ncbi:MAG TPA: D-cysteine desulfhydrase family protein [Bacteroidales bacterium]|nr:D-cysteine desulfhydrase family protein [Bacteroidales bacterium]
MKNRLSLGFFPTPLHKLDNLSAIYEPYDIFIKRDDQTGLVSGGNKTRKLEYLIAEALALGSKSVITIGAQQSNHCRQTAAACAVYGLECHLVFRGEEPAELTGNLLLCRMLGAKLYFVGSVNPDEYSLALDSQLSAKGLLPYLIPVGGSNTIGMIGYIDAVQELMMQQQALKIQFDYIYFASCSGGTQAGLAVGQRKYGLRAKLMPVSIQKPENNNPCLEEIVLNLCNAYALHNGTLLTFGPSDVEVVKGYDEPGYGVVTHQEKQALHKLATLEGIMLDPVYTARAFCAMTDHMENNRISKGAKVLFWHTGGFPANFHYARQLF